MAALCLLVSAVHATTITRNRAENGASCFDYIKIDLDNGCTKWITRDCDDSDPCHWLDRGWDCGGHGMIVSGGSPMPATFDGAGNLICTVAPGTGGVYSPSSSSGVCFAADSGTILMVTASILGDLH